MFEIVHQYTGEGKFHFVSSKEVFLDLGFFVTQYSNSKIEIKCFLSKNTKKDAIFGIFQLLQMNANKENITVSMDGKIFHPDGRIKVAESVIDIQNLHFDKEKGTTAEFTLIATKPVEIIFKELEPKEIIACAGFTNFVFNGFKNSNNNLKTFEVELDEFSVLFEQVNHYEENVKYLDSVKGSILVTSNVKIKFNSEQEFDFSETIENLSFLLSYACRTRISPIYELYFSDSECYKTVLNPVITSEFKKKQNLIDTGNNIDECNVKLFLENCYTNYINLLNKYGLNMVISFYLEGIKHNYLDISFLLFVTALETLLDEYARTQEKMESPITKNLDKKNKKEIIKILNQYPVDNKEEITELIIDKTSYPNLTILDKFNALIKDERHLILLDKYDMDFIQIRNKIAHTGKVPEKIKFNNKEREIIIWEECNRLIYLIDRILLTILNYRNKPFFNKLNDSITIIE